MSSDILRDIQRIAHQHQSIQEYLAALENLKYLEVKFGKKEDSDAAVLALVSHGLDSVGKIYDAVREEMVALKGRVDARLVRRP